MHVASPKFLQEVTLNKSWQLSHFARNEEAKILPDAWNVLRRFLMRKSVLRYRPDHLRDVIEAYRG